MSVGPEGPEGGRPGRSTCPLGLDQVTALTTGSSPSARPSEPGGPPQTPLRGQFPLKPQQQGGGVSRGVVASGGGGAGRRPPPSLLLSG